MKQGFKNILITGAAGFIGFHLVKAFADENWNIIGVDNLNNYYDVKLKLARLNETGIESDRVAYNETIKSKFHPNYSFIQLDLIDAANLERLFVKYKFNKVIHLAAQAGVRYSIKHPEAYVQSNIIGFFNILESCRHNEIEHLVFASSSSVYGTNINVPFKVQDDTDHPISFYAATKKSNELMAHSYSHLYNIKMTGLRFFTVYGPWGRPDMAAFIFTKSIINGQEIKVYNKGEMSRDFTYIDDIVTGIKKVAINKKKNKLFKIYNIGNNLPTNLLDFIKAIENAVGKKAMLQLLEMQPGEMKDTYADVNELMADFNYSPSTDIQTGVNKFVDWYFSFYNIKRLALA